MRITIRLSDAIHARLKRRAKQEGGTMSEVVEAALRQLFASTAKRPVGLPRKNMGPFLVDISDRDALYDALDDLSLYNFGKTRH
jgi:hypothetical protein